MKSGYKIRWTPNALKELKDTFDYLQENFTDKELKKLAREIEQTIELISKKPGIFRKSLFENVRRVVIMRFNTMYYRIEDNEIEILSFFSNRQDPENLKL